MASWWRIDRHILNLFKNDIGREEATSEEEAALRSKGIKVGEKLRVPNGERWIVRQGSLVCKRGEVVIKEINASSSRSANDSNSIANFNSEEIYVVNNSHHTAHCELT